MGKFIRIQRRSSQGPGVDVENSDLTYDVHVNSGDTLVLPDITHTDSDLSPVILPAQTPMICTPAVVQSGISYERFYHNNSKLSAALFDEGWLIDNGVLEDYTQPTSALYSQKLDPTDDTGNTLVHDNDFGNKIRFTNLNGTQSSNDGTAYTIDNLTGLAAGSEAINDTFNNTFGSGGLIEVYNDDEVDGFDDWFCSTAAILWRSSEQSPASGGVPYNKRATSFNSSTLLSTFTTAHVYLNNLGRISSQALTTVRHFLPVRIHFK